MEDPNFICVAATMAGLITVKVFKEGFDHLVCALCKTNHAQPNKIDRV